jgi:hypothetical protein
VECEERNININIYMIDKRRGGWYVYIIYIAIVIVI